MAKKKPTPKPEAPVTAVAAAPFVATTVSVTKLTIKPDDLIILEGPATVICRCCGGSVKVGEMCPTDGHIARTE